MAALAVAVAFPAHSLAEYYVPPENSAANQYTESFPGAGGEKGGKRKNATPADTLGARNAKRLEERGPAGKAAAELAAETAPSQPATAGEGDGESSAGGGAGGTGAGKGGGGAGTTAEGNGGQATQGANGGLGQAQKVDQPEGSSGFSQVLGQATGIDDGNVGIWLPLAILLTLAGSIAYAARTRQAGHGRHA